MRDLDRPILERHDPALVEHAAEIGAEFLRGFEAIERIGRPGVTVFGSARVRDGNPVYESARLVGELLVEAGFAVVTGGGPGVMEAANRGAQEAGGLSIGFNIQLAHEQAPNPYLDVCETFSHFYARKTMLVKAAEGFIMFAGGFGTLDEMFEALTLIQTDKVLHFPVVLVGRDYWRGLTDWIGETVLAAGLIFPEDRDLLWAVDDPRRAVEIVVDCYRDKHAGAVPAPAKATVE